MGGVRCIPGVGPRKLPGRSTTAAGRKKGAHYSAPMLWLTSSRSCDTLARRTAALVAALFTVLGCTPARLFAAQGSHPEADARRTEAQLQALKAEIERITRKVRDDQVERDRLTRELRAAEVSVGKARDGLDEVRHSRAETAARRASLAGNRRAREADLAENRSALAAQLRAAWLIGREEPLKLLLSQKDPERAGRMFV